MLLRSSIFDGEIVETLSIPKEIMNNPVKKEDWGIEALSGFLRKFIGDKAQWSVRPSQNHEGRLTGTQANFCIGDKRITYALIEPKTSNLVPKVHISKLEEDLNAGDFYDVIDHELSLGKKKFTSPLAAALQAATKKEDLPDLAEIVRLKVHKNRKLNMLMFEPTYPLSDPEADNKPSMRVFFTKNPIVMELGKIYRARIVKAYNTGKTNVKGLPIIKIEVTV
ncbi:MAG: hypothetical protein US83_C0014G0013 [Candidatus Falkowbacteria bacterium GW2011_GWC2_38_22]|uniref:Uncharacterized protein n=1 Tax=Candidatus Falkowbacteria bacterium GW2011_GWE1_38_31 TaxID=1618638 RepID=A0A0G0JQ12_9BACT|nr:MAG: hypothetical protein US73_C0011G0013 [Candidatus Falkowbacteria bacterium GW2011_GWF2_38_1205]KKQ60671.1 MAG: hypothetical protein US83_C0014G0013 [Candidatus Falkowbacteria bacterium GW2011_GWC2_38_22]KKQ62811.1 MAG: hypothetical protein US84_C0011G0013 [Candidatus Falkowbacteria bacterium GW2011_GWF1_38_22]KKQ64923.1 MAG: hypothetical protein US87_C0011G0013 [Candidatus Falkowbacteria bacterium GW2011_GWE2_38_254]KKQ69643.1 MAG: hypothetical protein US91_C0011G0013 [Candidatus Falkowb